MANIYEVFITTKYTISRVVKANSLKEAENLIENLVGSFDLMEDDDPQVEVTVDQNQEDYDDNDVDYDISK